jgi:coenzyme F420-reducing hydrogenase delta subunit
MDPTPHIVLLYCPRTLAAGEEDSLSSLLRQPSDVDLRPERIACGGSVQVPHLLKILEDGADAVQLVTCSEKECHSLTGSSRAAKRIQYASRLLSEFGLGGERLGIHQGRELGAADLCDLGRERAKTIESLGPHPMKTRMGETVV